MAKSTARTMAILRRVRETFKSAQFGLQQISSAELEERRIGLKNVVIYGRAVTNVLQNLRSIEPDFEPWYEGWQKELKEDSVCNYFYKLGSQILKQGKVATSMTLSFDLLTSSMIFQAMCPRPLDAKGFVIGDGLGGAGWEVRRPYGETEVQHLPAVREPGIGKKVVFHFSDAPENIRRIPVDKLCVQYMTKIGEIVEDAWKRFGR